MYTIRKDGNLIYDPRLDDMQILQGKLTREDNAACNFTFKPCPKNAYVGMVEKLSSIIEAYDDDRRLFRGRMLNHTQDINGLYTYTCEGELAFLGDSVVRPYDWRDGGVEAYLRFLIEQHNAQVDPSRRFNVRNVTVAEEGERIIRASTQYPTTLEEIGEKLISSLGGHLYLERVGNVTYIDYFDESPFESNQVIELGENIVDITLKTRGEEIATAIIPLGARTTSESGEDGERLEEGERLTIAEVNNGLDFVQDDDAVELYGFIARTVIYDDVTLPQNLIQRGRRALAQTINPVDNLEISAVDLKQLGVDVDALRFLDYVYVKSDLHRVHGRLLITKITTDLLNPAANTLTIGSEFGSFIKGETSTAQRLVSVENNAATSNQVYGAVTYHNQSTAATTHADIRGAIAAEAATRQTQINELQDEIDTQSETVGEMVDEIAAIWEVISNMTGGGTR